jgi:hypothetical protein
MGEQARRIRAIAAGKTRACGNCGFFRRHQLGRPLGNCHANPPTLVFIGQAQNAAGGVVPLTNTYWPAIPDTEWCGAHQPKIDLGAIDADALQAAPAEGTA